MRRSSALWLLLAMAAGAGQAQWFDYRTPGLPRTPDGKPDLTAPTPRTADGKPDLSGVWHVQPTTLEEWRELIGDEVDKAIQVPGMEIDTVSKYAFNIFFDFKPEEVPMRPAAAALFDRRARGLEHLPSTYCLPLGVPLATLVSELTKIVQTPGLTLILLELDNATRQIYTDGRPLPEDPLASWLGSSVGHWEGDTFVVETVGLNDRSWLDVLGHPRSEAMRIVERYTRRDLGHMDIELTFDDPELYTRPFTVKVTHLLQPDTDIFEYFCLENEKDLAHMPLP